MRRPPADEPRPALEPAATLSPWHRPYARPGQTLCSVCGEPVTTHPAGAARWRRLARLLLRREG
ncbi:MAG TPA: hypothetical protein VF661_16155 [Actinomycetales bacterium]